jgi:hypothetical protein
MINTTQDIEELSNEENVSEKVVAHIRDYYKRITEVYGVDYDPIASGCMVLLEKGDPLTAPIFLETIGIRGGQDLVSIIKEFVDFDCDANLYNVLVIFSADYALTYLIPNEEWVGQELLEQLQTFQN